MENGQIKLQDHIVQKINNFLNKLEDLKTLQSFLGLLNYDRLYIENLSRLARLLYNKTRISSIYTRTKEYLPKILSIIRWNI